MNCPGCCQQTAADGSAESSGLPGLASTECDDCCCFRFCPHSAAFSVGNGDSRSDVETSAAFRFVVVVVALF